MTKFTIYANFFIRKTSHNRQQYNVTYYFALIADYVVTHRLRFFFVRLVYISLLKIISELHETQNSKNMNFWVEVKIGEAPRKNIFDETLVNNLYNNAKVCESPTIFFCSIKSKSNRSKPGWQNVYMGSEMAQLIETVSSHFLHVNILVRKHLWERVMLRIV